MKTLFFNSKRIRKWAFLGCACILLLFQTTIKAQQNGRLIRTKILSKNIVDTPTGEKRDREVSIYLPSGYDEGKKRYPVVYLLHGIGDTDQTWTRNWTGDNSKKFQTIQSIMDHGISNGLFRELIVVMPNQLTKAGGSFYVNSIATGKWEDFTTTELVEFIDTNYRTIAKAESRGIAGHSMGGFGALTLGMKHPDVFGVVYGMNPGIIDWTEELTLENSKQRFEKIEAAKSFRDFKMPNDMLALATVTMAQAFSPNPKKKPFFCDLPFKKTGNEWEENGKAYSGWRDHAPIEMVQKYQTNLRKLNGYKFDSSTNDQYKFIPVNSREFSQELKKYDIAHEFEEYEGDHRNQIWGKKGRLNQNVIPYISSHLKRESEKDQLTGVWRWVRVEDNSPAIHEIVFENRNGNFFGVYKPNTGGSISSAVTFDNTQFRFEARSDDWDAESIFSGEFAESTIEGVQINGKRRRKWLPLKGVSLRNAMGPWQLEFKTADGFQTARPVITLSNWKDKEKPTIEFETGLPAKHTVEIEDVSFINSLLSFVALIEYEGGDLELHYKLHVADDTILGVVKYEYLDGRVGLRKVIGTRRIDKVVETEISAPRYASQSKLPKEIKVCGCGPVSLYNWLAAGSDNLRRTLEQLPKTNSPESAVLKIIDEFGKRKSVFDDRVPRFRSRGQYTGIGPVNLMFVAKEIVNEGGSSSAKITGEFLQKESNETPRDHLQRVTSTFGRSIENGVPILLHIRCYQLDDKKPKYIYGHHLVIRKIEAINGSKSKLSCVDSNGGVELEGFLETSDNPFDVPVFTKSKRGARISVTSKVEYGQPVLLVRLPGYESSADGKRIVVANFATFADVD